MALSIVLASVSLSSCSDDDKDTSSAGTSWVVLSNIDDSTGAENDTFEVGLIMTFQNDGNIKLEPPVGWTYPANPEQEWFYGAPSWIAWTYAKWEQNGNMLKLTCGEDEPDDYTYGTFIVNGDKATYKYSFYDYDGKWGPKGNYTMTLQRK